MHAKKLFVASEGTFWKSARPLEVYSTDLLLFSIYMLNC